MSLQDLVDALDRALPPDNPKTSARRAMREAADRANEALAALAEARAAGDPDADRLHGRMERLRDEIGEVA